MSELLYYLYLLQKSGMNVVAKLFPEFPSKTCPLQTWISSPEVVTDDFMFVSKDWNGYRS